MKKISSRRMVMLAVILLMFCAQSAFGMFSRFARIAGTQGLRSLTVSSPVRNPVLMRAYVASVSHMQCNQCVNQQSQNMSMKMRLALLASRVRSVIMPRVMTPPSSKIDCVVDDKAVVTAQQDALMYEQKICLAHMQDLIGGHSVDKEQWKRVFAIAGNLIERHKEFKADIVETLTDEICWLPQQEGDAFIELVTNSCLGITKNDVDKELEPSILYFIKRYVRNPEWMQMKEKIIALHNIAYRINDFRKTHGDINQKILEVVAKYSSDESRKSSLDGFVKHGILKMDKNEQDILEKYLRDIEDKQRRKLDDDDITTSILYGFPYPSLHDDIFSSSSSDDDYEA